MLTQIQCDDKMLVGKRKRVMTKSWRSASVLLPLLCSFFVSFTSFEMLLRPRKHYCHFDWDIPNFSHYHDDLPHPFWIFLRRASISVRLTRFKSIESTIERWNRASFQLTMSSLSSSTITIRMTILISFLQYLRHFHINFSVIESNQIKPIP